MYVGIVQLLLMIRQPEGPAQAPPAQGNCTTMVRVPKGDRMLEARVQLATFTDEISRDFEEAARVCAANDLRDVQIRWVWGGRNVVELDDDEIGRIRAIVDRHGLRVVGIGSPFGKCALTDAAYRDHLRHFERAIHLADLFGTRLIRVFAFLGDDPSVTTTDAIDVSPLLPRIADYLRGPAERAEREGLTLGLENEYSTLIGSCRQTRQVIDAVGSPALRVCWDVASGWYAEEPILPPGYDQIRGLVCDVHVRDAAPDPADPTRHGEPCRMGEGVIAWPEVIRHLREDGYTGHFTLETHLYTGDPDRWAKLSAATVHAGNVMRRLLAM
jgi:sugar phosphate isomerase/epimerase